MGSIAFQITSLTIVYSIVYSVADQRKHQSSASLAFVRGTPHKWPVTRRIFPLDDVIMTLEDVDKLGSADHNQAQQSVNRLHIF